MGVGITVTLMRRGARGGKKRVRWRYWLKWQDADGWHEKAVRTKNKKHAEQIREWWEDVVNERGPKGEAIRWKAFEEEYLEAYKADHARASHHEAKGALKRFREVYGPKFLSDVTPRMVERFKVARFREVAGRTVAKDLRTLHAAFAWAVTPMGYLAANPAEGVTVGRLSKPEPEVYSPEQTAALLRIASERAAWVEASVRLGAIWGLRAGELAHLELADVDLTARRVRIRPKKAWAPKNPRRPRIVPVDDHTGGLLQELGHGGGYLLRAPGAGETKYLRGLRDAVREIAKEAGVPVLPKVLHGLRATAYTAMRNRGVPQHVINAVVGHTTAAVGDYYDGTTPDQAAGIALDLVGALWAPPEG